MTVAASELVSLTIFPAPTVDDRIPDAFPSIILEYLDPLVDPKACYVFVSNLLCLMTEDYRLSAKLRHRPVHPQRQKPAVRDCRSREVYGEPIGIDAFGKRMRRTDEKIYVPIS